MTGPYQGPSFDEARARRMAQIEQVQEMEWRRVSCPTCKRGNPEPCLGRDANNQRIELDRVHVERRWRFQNGW